jgi:hypothetical protein
VSVSEACPVLERWDLRDDLDSSGAILFRRFAERALGSTAAGLGPASLPSQEVFARPFDASDPVHTPRGLNTGSEVVRAALADAVKDLRDSRIPLDAKLRDWQYEERGERIPIHGGPGTVGVFNAINVRWQPGRGYPDVPSGSSFIMAMQFTDSGPRSEAFVTYNQSENPRSPYFSDQTKRFSEKRWLDMKFQPEKIVRDPDLKLSEFGCLTMPGFRRGGFRGARRGARVDLAPALALPAKVEVFRASRGRRVHRNKRVTRLERTGSFAWRRSRLRSGWYFARLSASEPTGKADVRETAFRVRRGRIITRGAPRFSRPDGCGALRAARLTSPVFRGSRRRGLGVLVRPAEDARVSVRLKRGRRIVKSTKPRVVKAGALRRLRVSARGVRRGGYRVVIVALMGKTRATSVLTVRAL